jgi:hypothetical protein
VLLTMFDPRLRLAGQVAAEVRRYFGDKVFKSVIHRNVRVAEAPSFGKPVLLYDVISAGSKHYMSLAHEVIHNNQRYLHAFEAEEPVSPAAPPIPRLGSASGDGLHRPAEPEQLPARPLPDLAEEPKELPAPRVRDEEVSTSPQRVAEPAPETRRYPPPAAPPSSSPTSSRGANGTPSSEAGRVRLASRVNDPLAHPEPPSSGSGRTDEPSGPSARFSDHRPH